VQAYLASSILGQAQARQIIRCNLRDYHDRPPDDRRCPYGGGGGW
jgi:hypothetical protein